jgi:hypothetical protein
MVVGIAVPQNGTLGALWRLNPPEQAGFTVFGFCNIA